MLKFPEILAQFACKKGETLIQFPLLSTFNECRVIALFFFTKNYEFIVEPFLKLFKKFKRNFRDRKLWDRLKSNDFKSFFKSQSKRIHQSNFHSQTIPLS